MSRRGVAEAERARPTDATARRIRVVHCLDSFEVGGTEMNAVRTMERLDRGRFDLRFLCLSPRGPLEERVRNAGIPIVPWPIGSLSSFRAVRRGFALARWLRRERIDILHAHDVYSNIFAVPWARLSGQPRVIASRRWWSEVHSDAHARLDTLSYRFAHRVLANSSSIADMLREKEHVPARKLVVISNFVDDEAFTAPDATWVASRRAELGLRDGSLIVGIVANLLPVKNHAMLLGAFNTACREVPNMQLVLVGEGPERERLTTHARELGIESRIVFAGRRPSAPSFHWLFDISVLASRQEGFPNSIVEAMAAGRPVIATRVGGVPDAVVHGETGLLVRADSADEMAAAMVQLTRDPARRLQLGAMGAQRARSRYSSSMVITQLERLYEQLAQKSIPL